ncbi:MAG: hypothetical protein ACXWG1_17475 [Usitatibacter sp.]
MWTPRIALALLGCAGLAAAAEPRVAGMDAALEASLARGNYLFVWDIDRATVGRGDPYRTLRTYYDGLVYAVTEARRLVEPGTPAHLQLEPMSPVRGWDESYSGTFTSRETYLEGDPAVMHAEITRRDCDSKRAQVFFVLSYSPRDDPAWDGMRKVRDAISCGSPKN